MNAHRLSGSKGPAHVRAHPGERLRRRRPAAGPCIGGEGAGSARRRRRRPWLVLVLWAALAAAAPGLAGAGEPGVLNLWFDFPADEIPAEVFVDLLAYASDADGDPLTCTAGSPGVGTLGPVPGLTGADAGCVLLYRPCDPPCDPAGYDGDSFGFTVSDGAAATAGAVFFTVGGDPGVVGPRPPAVIVVALGPRTVELRWFDGNQGQASYRVYRSEGAGPLVELPPPGPPDPSGLVVYQDGGVQPDTLYSYRVDACTGGQCAAGTVALVQTPGTPPALCDPVSSCRDGFTVLQGQVLWMPDEELLSNDEPPSPQLAVDSWDFGGINGFFGTIERYPEPPNDAGFRFISDVGVPITPPGAATSFTYRATDGVTVSDPIPVDITITPGDEIHAQDKTFSDVDEGRPYAIPYAALIEGSGGAPGQLVEPLPAVFSRPLHGRIDICCDPAEFLYVPDEGYVGDDEFLYTLKSSGFYSVATVHLEVRDLTAPDPVEAVNDLGNFLLWEPPSAEGSGYEVQLPFAFSDLLGNDVGDGLELDGGFPPTSTAAFDMEVLTPGYDGDPLPPGYDGIVLYRSSQDPGDFRGDTSTYRVRDAGGASDTANIKIKLYPRSSPSGPPVFQAAHDLVEVADSIVGDIEVASGEEVFISKQKLVENDFFPQGLAPQDLIQPGWLGRPLRGERGFLGSINAVGYRAPTDYVGADTFTYTIERQPEPNVIERSMARVVVKVVEGRPAPDDEVAETCPGRGLSIPVLIGDTDPQDQPLHLAAVSEPGAGVALIAGETVAYLPGPGFGSAGDSFTYRVEDSVGNSAEGAVTITYRAPPAPPEVDILCEAYHCRFTGADPALGYDFLFAGAGSPGEPPPGGSVEHTFETAGIQAVEVIVSDGVCTERRTLVVDVDPAEAHDPPHAAFGMTALGAGRYRFDASTASTDDVGILGCAWDPGDGGQIRSSGPTVEWTYQPGAYEVTLTVCDHAHQCTQRTKDLTVP